MKAEQRLAGDMAERRITCKLWRERGDLAWEELWVTANGHILVGSSERRSWVHFLVLWCPLVSSPGCLQCPEISLCPVSRER